MLKLKDLLKEDLEDMDVSLPSKIEKFLDRALGIIKSYNLPRKKEQLVVAKLIDALGMDKMELMRYVQKIKKSDILNK